MKGPFFATTGEAGILLSFYLLLSALIEVGVGGGGRGGGGG